MKRNQPDPSFGTRCIHASWTFAAIVLALAVPGLALAQNVYPAPVPVLLPSRPLGHTPVQVLDGRATMIEHYESSKLLRITIGLTPPHLAEERRLIDELHDKNSPEFHKWLTPEQWDARFAPSVEDEQAVVDWARSQGLSVTNRFADRLLVDIIAPAGAIERAFNVRINSYKMDEATYFANDRDPEVPSSLAHTVQSVMGLNSFLRLRSHTSASNEAVPQPDFVPGPPIAEEQEQQADGSREKLDAAMEVSRERMAGSTVKPAFTGGSYDPTDMYSSQAYDTKALNNLGHCCNPYHAPVPPPETTIALAAFGDLAYSDVQAFHTQYPYLAVDVKKLYVDGTYTCALSTPQPFPAKPLPYDLNCEEVTLDTEWSLAMANSFGAAVYTSKIFVYEGAKYSDIADVYNQMVTDNYARVSSTSWGCTEFACFDGPTMDTLDAIFSKMVGQGWTLIAAAGDQGATDGCTHGIAVQFPASDPNFVAAGGTTLSLSTGPIYQSEVAWTGNTTSGSCAKNGGGTGGGFSQHFAAPAYQSFGYANRSLPDIALNASRGQNIYFAKNSSSVFGIGGTSIVAPELAGFFAQQNAYGLAIGNACGRIQGACAPIGNPNYPIYDEGNAQTSAHYPFYDITSGCNGNDVTAANFLQPYCAGPGFDQVSGWGSFNMLQLAWAINWFDAFTDGTPSITFTGPKTNVWFNTNQTISWTVTDNTGRGGAPTGIAGLTQGWDALPADPSLEATPGTGNSFYSGPQIPNVSSGCLQLAGAKGCQGPAPQGCHTAYVQAWNNMGRTFGPQPYGPVCFDNVPPLASISLKGPQTGGIYTGPVTVTIASSDVTSGLFATYYMLDGVTHSTIGGFFPTFAPFTVGTGLHFMTAYSEDNAGNKSIVQTAFFSVKSATSIKLASSANPVLYGNAVTLTVSVTPSFDPAPVGTVTFSNGTAVLGTASLAGGKASLAVSSGLAVGSYSITAVYSGNTHDDASTSTPLTLVIKQAGTSTALASSANPQMYGESVTFTASVKAASAGIPGGSVSFRDGSAILGTVPLTGGKAAYSTKALSVGSHTITTVYSGATGYIASTSSALTQTVAKDATTTAISSSANPSSYEQTFTLSVTVHSGEGTPSGVVTLKNGSTNVGTASLVSGKATFSVTSLSVGTIHYSATYAGSADFSASTSATFSQVENKAGTSIGIVSSLNPAVHGTAVTLTATVKPATIGSATGVVLFKDGTASLGTASLASGKAVLTSAALTVGAHAITAVYEGSADYLTSTSAPLNEVVK